MARLGGLPTHTAVLTDQCKTIPPARFWSPALALSTLFYFLIKSSAQFTLLAVTALVTRHSSSLLRAWTRTRTLLKQTFHSISLRAAHTHTHKHPHTYSHTHARTRNQKTRIAHSVTDACKLGLPVVCRIPTPSNKNLLDALSFPMHTNCNLPILL